MLRPIPEAGFHFRFWNPGLRAVYWHYGYYRLASGEVVNFPMARVRKWHPGYWLISWRIHRHGTALVRDVCPQGKSMSYQAFRGETPSFATKEEMVEWVRQMNEPYDWPRTGAKKESMK